MTQSTIFVNADDFGYNDKVNRAIISSMQADLVTSTSLMVNMPGFDDAIAMANLYPKLKGKIGLHLNLTEGFPLTTALHAHPVFCNPATGEFTYQRKSPLFRISRQLEAALYEELNAQIEKAVDAGIQPAHIDSHHHVHTEWALAPIVCRLAKTYGISRIRLTRNMGGGIGYSRQIYKKLYNSWQLGRYRGFANTDYFGDIEDFGSFPTSMLSKGKRIEIMVHPLFNEQGILVDMDQQDLRSRLQTLLEHSLIRRSTPNDF